MKAQRRAGLLAALLVVMILVGPVVFAQEAAEDEQRPIGELWGDFLHYIRMARADLARSFGQAILDSGAEPREIYLLSVKTAGSSAALGRGMALEGVADIIEQIKEMIEEGHKDLRKDPKEIANAIAMLGGTVRGFDLAARRLAASGEYALPQLIQVLRDPATPETLSERVTEVLPRLGKHAVRPLSVALQTEEPKLQEIIAGALARIEYPHSAPRLKELAEREGVLPRTRKLANIALITCAGQAAMAKNVAAIYYDLAVDYYYQRESLAPDIRHEIANVWYWDEGAGLTYKSVPRAILCDIYAMRMSRLALAHDGRFYPAVPLWIAANLKRTADLPEGAADLTYGEDTPDAKYFTLSTSAGFLQDVLARALNDKNPAVALGAIEALAKTAGAKNLVKPVAGGAQPLVEALSCPDRNVRFLAALSLANALPQEGFAGSQLVTNRLIDALRQTGQKTALLVVADQQLRNDLKDALRAADYRVIDQPDPGTAIAEAHKSAGVDVAVLAIRPNPVQIVAKFRQDPALLTLPVLVVGRMETLKAMAAKDGRIVQIAAGADAEAVAAGLAKAAETAAGQGISPQAAADWTIRAARAIEHLGRTANPVFDIARATKPLADLLASSDETVRLAAMKALSVVDAPEAQKAVAGLAVSDDTPEHIRIVAFNDLSASLRRYGNQLDDAAAESVLAVVSGDAAPELLNAAAQALGAMNLPSDKTMPLILGTSN